MSPVIKPEWDTPPHGDFVRYVERLSAGSAAAPSAGHVQPHSEHTRLKPAPGQASSPGAGAAAGASHPTEPSFFFIAVRGVRAFLLGVVVLQIAGLISGNLDSWVGIFLASGLWLALGFVQKIAQAVLAATGKAGAQAGLAQLQQQLAQMSQQRNKGKRK